MVPSGKRPGGHGSSAGPIPRMAADVQDTLPRQAVRRPGRGALPECSGPGPAAEEALPRGRGPDHRCGGSAEFPPGLAGTGRARRTTQPRGGRRTAFGRFHRQGPAADPVNRDGPARLQGAAASGRRVRGQIRDIAMVRWHRERRASPSRTGGRVGRTRGTVARAAGKGGRGKLRPPAAYARLPGPAATCRMQHAGPWHGEVRWPFISSIRNAAVAP